MSRGKWWLTFITVQTIATPALVEIALQI